MRPLPEPSRFDRLSLGSPEELGLLLDTTALFEVLPVREMRPLSESPCTSLEDVACSEDLCLECSPCNPLPEPFRLANASTAPESLSRTSGLTGVFSTLSAEGPGLSGSFPTVRPLELEPEPI